MPEEEEVDEESQLLHSLECMGSNYNLCIKVLYE